MDTSRLALTVLGVAILAVAGWLAYRAIDEAISITSGWEILVGDPILVGDVDDPYAYAGGDRVRSLEGAGRIVISERAERGFVRLSVRLDGTAEVLALGEGPIGELTLRSDIAMETILGKDTSVHGGTALGDPGLPETQALLLGSSSFDLRLDGDPVERDLAGIWTLAHALRREDGAIRNQGLVFTPLLRDDTVFSDPDRLELTLLLYERAEDGNKRIVLHLVFRDVEVANAPNQIPTQE